jgi:hypothetical protein
MAEPQGAEAQSAEAQSAEAQSAVVKQRVKEFYDQVGWQEIGAGLYQNSHYEDLRPVARPYIHNCHLRVMRHLPRAGKYLLDAGSGPVQYMEYVEYSQGYERRVCADISIQALQEARKRLGAHGLYVVADVANLPFAPGAFDGIVSLHTIHHLPEDEHLQAYHGLYRLLAEGGSAVVVNGWPSSRLMSLAEPLIQLRKGLGRLRARLLGRTVKESRRRQPKGNLAASEDDGQDELKGTFTSRHDAAWIRSVVGAAMPVEIYPWRSVSTRFIRNLIHPRLGGQAGLRLVYWLEERFPRFFGEQGQYPIIVIRRGAARR